MATYDFYLAGVFASQTLTGNRPVVTHATDHYLTETRIDLADGTNHVVNRLGLGNFASGTTGYFLRGNTGGTPTYDAKSTITLDGFGAAAADVSLGGFKITNLATPTADSDAATKAYTDSLSAGLDIKGSVVAATTVAGTLASSFENGDAIDGITLATGDRILIKNQTLPKENGIYTVNASGAPTRATDMDAWSEVPGAFTFIEKGTQADTGWVCSADQGGTLGTTDITFVQFSYAGVLVADEATLTKSGLTLSEKDGGTTLAKLANLAQNTFIARFSSGTGVPEAAGLASDHEFSSGNLRIVAYSGGDITKAAGATSATITANAVDNTKLADMAALTVKARTVNSSGDPSDLSIDADYKILQRIGSVLSSVYHTTRQGTGAPPSAVVGDVGTMYYRVSSFGGGIGAIGRLYLGVQTA